MIQTKLTYPIDKKSKELIELCKFYLALYVFDGDGWQKSDIHKEICEQLGITTRSTKYFTDDLFTSLELPASSEVRIDWNSGYYGSYLKEDGMNWKVLIVDDGKKLKELFEKEARKQRKSIDRTLQ